MSTGPKKKAYAPHAQDLKLAPHHVAHDIRRLREAFNRSQVDAMAWTAWYIHCRAVMDFFESAPKDVTMDDILATHYLPDSQAGSWRQLVQQNKPESYDGYRHHVNKLAAHLTYERVVYQHGLDGHEYAPSAEITDYLLALSRLFYDRLSQERKAWFGGLFR